MVGRAVNKRQALTPSASPCGRRSHEPGWHLYNPGVLKALLVSLRPPQWPKNVFVLAPLLFSQQLDDFAAARRGALALLAFIAAAGAIYLFNDIRDRDQDRLHPRNRLRPLAAGTLQVPVALTPSFSRWSRATFSSSVLGSV